MIKKTTSTGPLGELWGRARGECTRGPSGSVGVGAGVAYQLEVVDRGSGKGVQGGPRLVGHREADAVHVRLIGGDADIGAVLRERSQKRRGG